MKIKTDLKAGTDPVANNYPDLDKLREDVKAARTEFESKYKASEQGGVRITKYCYRY